MTFEDLTADDCLQIAQALDFRAWMCNRHAYDAQANGDTGAASEILRNAAASKQLEREFAALRRQKEAHAAHAAPSDPHAAPSDPHAAD